MKSLPVRRQQFQLADFAAWLARSGAEVGVPTNPYEVIRYRAFHGDGNRAQTHIVYAKENGLLTYVGASRLHYTQFATGAAMYPEQIPGNPPGGWQRPDGSPMRKDKEPALAASEKRRQKLRDRDGDECWFCGLPLGADATIEHLVPKSNGGRNALANYALAHSRCNQKAANLPLVKKIEMRAALRAASAVAAEGDAP